MSWIGYEVKEKHFGPYIRLREGRTGNVYAFGEPSKNLTEYRGLIFKNIPKNIFTLAYGPSTDKIYSRSLSEVELLKYILLM